MARRPNRPPCPRCRGTGRDLQYDNLDAALTPDTPLERALPRRVLACLWRARLSGFWTGIGPRQEPESPDLFACRTLGELARIQRVRFFQIRALGRKKFLAIEDALQRAGLCLAG